MDKYAVIRHNRMVLLSFQASSLDVRHSLAPVAWCFIATVACPLHTCIHSNCTVVWFLVHKSFQCDKWVSVIGVSGARGGGNSLGAVLEDGRSSFKLSNPLATNPRLEVAHSMIRTGFTERVLPQVPIHDS